MPTKKQPRYKTAEGAVCSIAEESPTHKDEQAALLNIPKSLFYRAVNRYDDEVLFKLRWLTPFMRLHNDFTPLEIEANNNGFMLVKMPRGSLNNGDAMKLILTYQSDFNTIITNLIQFFTADPSEEIRQSLLQSLKKHIEDSAGMRQRVKRENGQPDLFENE